ncbi:MAG: adenosylcobinamide amidohydrolase [Bacillota bacterium]
MTVIFRSPAQHDVLRKENNIVLHFSRPMAAYSTSQLNGGITKIKSCFNHQLTEWIETVDDLPGGSIKNYLITTALGLGLDWTAATGLITAASMDMAAIKHVTYREMSLFAVITAGVDVNAVRAGETALYYEESYGKYVPAGGTINIFLIMEFFLPVESLARVPIIVTEAKAAALQDLNVLSCFSGAVATGTGTDGLVAACHREDHMKFSDVGTHSKLGELIGSIVKRGIIEALEQKKS